MPCHVPATSASSRRPRPSLPLRPPVPLAALDLGIPSEREAHDRIRRFGSGRWPLWRILGMRRDGPSLYVAVEWRRCRGQEPFSIVEMSLQDATMRWWDVPTSTEARLRLHKNPLAKCR